MAVEGTAALIVALGGLGGFAALIGTVLAYRRATNADKNSSMVSNYQTLYKELRTDVNRIRDEQREERKQWADERKDLHGKIETLQTLIRDQDKALHAKEIEVTELRGRIEVLTVQLETYKSAPPTKAITVNT